MSEKVLLGSEKIQEIVQDLSKKIYEDIEDINRFAVVGVQTRGVELARRIGSEIEKLGGVSIPRGVLDITLFRDDLATRGVLPAVKETRIDFDISSMTILLVDDVIFTGRTMKAALETLMSFGRPSVIRLFELIDRGKRELPIQPDYCGFTISTELSDKIRVRLKPIDDVEDTVVLVKGESE